MSLTDITLYLMTNYVQIPGMPIIQIRQMPSHPTPVTEPPVQRNPLINPLCDIK